MRIAIIKNIRTISPDEERFLRAEVFGAVWGMKRENRLLRYIEVREIQLWYKKDRVQTGIGKGDGSRTHAFSTAIL